MPPPFSNSARLFERVAIEGPPGRRAKVMSNCHVFGRLGLGLRASLEPTDVSQGLGWAWTVRSLPSLPLRPNRPRSGSWADSAVRARLKHSPRATHSLGQPRLWAMFLVQGFSQYMSLPALAANIDAVACHSAP